MDQLILQPFLLFDGTCAEAMTFYESCLEGEAIEFSATDWLHPARTPRQGNTVAMNLSGGPSELRRVFDRLSDGADPSLLDDLREMPFGLYGRLADRYGVHWFFNQRGR